MWNKLFRRDFVTEKELSFLENAQIFEDVYFTVTSLSLAERIGKCEGVLVHHRVYQKQVRSRVFRKKYAQVPAVYMAIKEFLIHRGLYLPLSSSFINLSVGICFKVYNLLWIDAKLSFWTLLHDTYAESFGWTELDESGFSTKEIRDFAANVSMYTYPQYLKREARGLTVRFADWRRRIKAKKKRSKARSFFAGLFGKKS